MKEINNFNELIIEFNKMAKYRFVSRLIAKRKVKKFLSKILNYDIFDFLDAACSTLLAYKNPYLYTSDSCNCVITDRYVQMYYDNVRITYSHNTKTITVVNGNMEYSIYRGKEVNSKAYNWDWFVIDQNIKANIIEIIQSIAYEI